VRRVGSSFEEAGQVWGLGSTINPLKQTGRQMVTGSNVALEVFAVHEKTKAPTATTLSSPALQWERRNRRMQATVFRAVVGLGGKFEESRDAFQGFAIFAAQYS
jgi:hypothetical protein